MTLEKQLGWDGFLTRWLAKIVLVVATYNGSSFNFVTWVVNGPWSQAPFMLCVGAFLGIAYLFVLRATAQSLGATGTILFVVLFAGVIWSLITLALFTIVVHTVVLYAVLLCIATLLAVGMSWSIIQRRITGQVDVGVE